MHCGYTVPVKVILAVMKQLKQFAKKAQKTYPVEASEFYLGFLSNCFSASWLRGSLNFTSICIMLSLPGLTKFLSTFAHTVFFIFLFLQPPTKGKQATKGQKQIRDENLTTIDFYSKIMISIEVRYFGI